MEDVKKMNTREVLQALSYEMFLNDFQRAFFEMERP